MLWANLALKELVDLFFDIRSASGTAGFTSTIRRMTLFAITLFSITLFTIRKVTAAQIAYPLIHAHIRVLFEDAFSRLESAS